MGQHKTIDTGDRPGAGCSNGRPTCRIFYGNGNEFERIAIIGGSEHRDQSPPSGKGRYYFESYDPCMESFGTTDAQELYNRIFSQLGCVRLVRMKENEWSVEDSENIYGTITEIVGGKPSIPECLAASKESSEKRIIVNCSLEIVVVNHVPEASP